MEVLYLGCSAEQVHESVQTKTDLPRSPRACKVMVDGTISQQYFVRHDKIFNVLSVETSLSFLADARQVSPRGSPSPACFKSFFLAGDQHLLHVLSMDSDPDPDHLRT